MRNLAEGPSGLSQHTAVLRWCLQLQMQSRSDMIDCMHLSTGSDRHSCVGVVIEVWLTLELEALKFHVT